VTLSFMRNKVLEVEPLADGNLSVSWRFLDAFAASEIRTVFRLPDLEIISAEAVSCGPLTRNAPKQSLCCKKWSVSAWVRGSGKSFTGS